jgi:hypothetical protein
MIGLGLSVYKSQGISIGGGGSSYTPPLDSVTAAVAYSVRKLNSTYTGDCMLVRRVSDGATQDIGFDSDGLIDVAALTAFSGGVELTVKVWYDQAGGGFDLEQPNDAYLPTIYDGTSVTTSTSGKPCVRIVRVSNNGPGEWLQTDPVSLSTAGDMDVFLVFHGPFASGGDRYFWNSQAGPTTSGARWGIAYNTNTYVQQPGLAVPKQLLSTPIPDNLQFILNAQYNPSGNINTLEGNGVEFGTYTSSTTYRTDPYNVTLGARTGGLEGYNSFDISEIIHLPTYNASENASLGLNINSYYEFTNWTPTSGFLADYTGAAAAYSVRQLSNNAIKCMRVRRAVPPYDEQDIGFTAGGDLDEASIVAFGGSDELRVSAWYDQSGQSNHATQINPNSQPKIYNGTAVITDNGKPALDIRTPNTTTPVRLDLSVPTLAQPLTFAITQNMGTNSPYRATISTPANTLALLSYGGNQIMLSPTQVQGTVDLTQQREITAIYDSPSSSLFVDGNTILSNVNTGTNGLSSNSLVIGGTQATQYWLGGGTIQEYILWNSNQDSAGNRTAIETNINSYFQIYP